ncbi:MAG: hypothetical protein CFH38_00963, partial [Alphaproteobacteria bacterium MarineAlpha10_Bin1]
MAKTTKMIALIGGAACLALLSAAVAGNTRALAAPPVLEVPVACELGRDCFIQFYVDRDAQSGVKDYRCAGLTY